MSMMVYGPPNGDQKQPPKKGKEFSKLLLIQESVLIWIVTIACIIMAFICIFTASFVELPWITAMAACPWGAYAISQNAYYKKAMMENTQGGIIYDGLFGASNPSAPDPNQPQTPVG